MVEYNKLIIINTINNLLLTAPYPNIHFYNRD